MDDKTHIEFEVNLFPRFDRLVGYVRGAVHELGRIVTLQAFLPENADLTLTEHPHGASELLDYKLYQPSLFDETE